MARHVANISALFSVEDSAPITITHISLCLSKTDSWLYWRKEVIYRPPSSEIAEANDAFEDELDEIGEAENESDGLDDPDGGDDSENLEI